MDTLRPKVSVIVPIHDMHNGDKFLWRLVNSLTKQTLKDWELIITKDGKMAENTNSGIKRARGEFIKIMYLDDYFSDEFVLQDMVDYFEPTVTWMIAGTHNNPKPYWTDDIHTGNNHLGSPSALMIRNKEPMLFDEEMSWLLDCDLYRRMFDRYGPPYILTGNYITLGEGEHQMTHLLSNEEKLSEHKYMQKKYERSN